MGSKSEAKKQLIISAAKKLFCERGFYSITMKDIVEECDISRGGLYLYFENTKQIFLEVLRCEHENTPDPFEGKITRDTPAIEIIAMFLKEQKKEILKKTDSLTLASYEFFFRHKAEGATGQLRTTFDESVDILSELIKISIENGEIINVNPKAAARNIMFVLEGMKIAALTMDIDQKMVDQQLLYIIDILMVPEE